MSAPTEISKNELPGPLDVPEPGLGVVHKVDTGHRFAEVGGVPPGPLDNRLIITRSHIKLALSSREKPPILQIYYFFIQVD